MFDFVTPAHAANSRVDEVSAWAELVDRYGAMMIVGLVLGLFFLLVSSVMFRRLLSQAEAQEKQRLDREKSVNDERRELVDRVVEVTRSATESTHASADAIRDMTRELVEFRRDTHRAFQQVEKAFELQGALIEARSKESAASHELTRKAIANFDARLSHLEGRRESDSFAKFGT